MPTAIHCAACCGAGAANSFNPTLPSVTSVDAAASTAPLSDVDIATLERPVYGVDRLRRARRTFSRRSLPVEIGLAAVRAGWLRWRVHLGGHAVILFRSPRVRPQGQADARRRRRDGTASASGGRLAPVSWSSSAKRISAGRFHSEPAGNGSAPGRGGPLPAPRQRPGRVVRMVWATLALLVAGVGGVSHRHGRRRPLPLRHRHADGRHRVPPRRFRPA